MLDKPFEETWRYIFEYARGNRHQYVTVEHLLLGLLGNDDATEVLLRCGADLEHLNRATVACLQRNMTLMDEQHKEYQPQVSPGFQRVIQRAMQGAKMAGREQISGAYVLVALFTEEESDAVYLLNKQEIDRYTVTSYLSHGISNVKPDEEGGEESRVAPTTAPRRSEAERSPPNFIVNLNEVARQDGIDPVIGRHSEIMRVEQILCRRHKNNPVLVGEAGVGKTAIIEGLALKIVEGDVPDVLAEATIYSLDLAGALAGTRYRGDFEKRLKGMLSHLCKDENSILFIDEIHMLVGAGAASGGTVDAGNMLKPLLSKGKLRCIGATTFKEYRSILEQDRALSRRFQKVDIQEPSVQDTYKILRGLKCRFEKHHELRYTDRALRSAAELSDRYISHLYLPDKAIDVIDEAGSWQRLRAPSQRRRQIGVAEIEHVVSQIARVPTRTVTSSDKDRLMALDSSLRMTIFGQDQAITALSSAIKTSRAGLGKPTAPVGSFLFSGPTGVGKTELCRQLAKALGVELVRFDMSEYMERHTVSRLVGAPPGYVGFDQGGLLTKAITQNPYCVLLFDEMEKAHPEVYSILLQVMDHGTLTDSNGRKANFRNAILIMTTNAGAESISRRSIGFTDQDNSGDALQAIQKIFSPEFRNRLDAIIQFNPLDDATLLTVVDKFLAELQAQLDSKKVQLDFDEAVRRWLVRHGYDQHMGARPMDRVIQERIKRPLADMLIDGPLADDGGVLRIRVDAGDAADGSDDGLSLRALPKRAERAAEAKPAQAPKRQPKPRKPAKTAASKTAKPKAALAQTPPRKAAKPKAAAGSAKTRRQAEPKSGPDQSQS